MEFLEFALSIAALGKSCLFALQLAVLLCDDFTFTLGGFSIKALHLDTQKNQFKVLWLKQQQMEIAFIWLVEVDW